MQAVADLDFGLGEHFRCIEPKIFFSAPRKKMLPLWTLLCSPYVKFIKAQAQRVKNFPP